MIGRPRRTREEERMAENDRISLIIEIPLTSAITTTMHGQERNVNVVYKEVLLQQVVIPLLQGQISSAL